MKKFLMFGLTAIMAIAGPMMMRSLQEKDLVGAAGVGQVVSVAEAEPYVPRGFGAWFFGTPQTDRITVTTTTGRFLISGMTTFPTGASVEVRDTIDGERTFCVTDSKSCGRLWNDATLVPVQNSEAASFREMMKYATILMVISLALGGLVLGLRSALRI